MITLILLQCAFCATAMDLRFTHLDTTSCALTGAYVPESDAHAIRLTHGDAKDHRPDLKQAVLGRCFRAVDMLPSHRRRDIPSGVRGAMITQVLHCPYCDETDIVRHGMSPEGKQRYRCRQCLEGRGRTFLLEYAYAGQSPAVKQQIVDMAMNASGIRDTARVLHVSPTTVIKELKKRNLHSSK
jgi:transposase-like protein